MDKLKNQYYKSNSLINGAKHVNVDVPNNRSYFENLLNGDQATMSVANQIASIVNREFEKIKQNQIDDAS
jgi:hypothetical protein